MVYTSNPVVQATGFFYDQVILLLLLTDYFSALNEPDEDHDDGDNKENMNEPADNRESEESESPKNNEDDCDGCKHIIV
jgi:hypothetical protein